MSKRIALVFVAVVFLSAGLLFIRPPQARAVYSISPILLIHGWNGHYAVDCNSTWSIRHLTCRMAWWIWNNYTQYGTTVGVVAHSMGGILIRQILNDTAWVHPTFPPYLKIWDVATAGSPHQGLRDGASGLAFFAGCGSPCRQVDQMQKSNDLMRNMNDPYWRNGTARNPQGNGGTDWTNLASNNDELLFYGCTNTNNRMGAPSVVYTEAACGLMPGAKHFVVYPGYVPYYNHGGYLTDNNTAWDALEAYSDNNGGVWSYVPNSQHSIFTMHYAMLYSTW